MRASRSCAERGNTPTVTDSCVGAAGKGPHSLSTSAAAPRAPGASPRTFLPWHPGRGHPFAEASRDHSRRSFREQTSESGAARGRTAECRGNLVAANQESGGPGHINSGAGEDVLSEIVLFACVSRLMEPYVFLSQSGFSVSASKLTDQN